MWIYTLDATVSSVKHAVICEVLDMLNYHIYLFQGFLVIKLRKTMVGALLSVTLDKGSKCVYQVLVYEYWKTLPAL